MRRLSCPKCETSIEIKEGQTRASCPSCGFTGKVPGTEKSNTDPTEPSYRQGAGQRNDGAGNRSTKSSTSNGEPPRGTGQSTAAPGVGGGQGAPAGGSPEPGAGLGAGPGDGGDWHLNRGLASLAANRAAQVALVLFGLAGVLLAIGGGIAMGRILAEAADATDVPGEFVGFSVFYYVVLVGLLCFGGFAFAARANVARGRLRRGTRQFLGGLFGVWLFLGGLLIYTAAAFDGGVSIELGMTESVFVTISAVLGILATVVYTWPRLGIGQEDRGPGPDANHRGGTGMRDAMGLFLGLAALVLLLVGTTMLPEDGVLGFGGGATWAGFALGLGIFIEQLGGAVQLAGLLTVLVGLAIGLARGRLTRLASLSVASIGLLTVGIGGIVHTIDWHTGIADASSQDVYPWDLIGDAATPNTIEVGWGFIWAANELIILATLSMLVLGGLGLFVHGRSLFEAVAARSSQARPAGQTTHSGPHPGTAARAGVGQNVGGEGGHSQVGVQATTARSGPCPRCGSQIGADARFCPNCGHDSHPQGGCPHCGAPADSEAAYCQSCGGQLR